MLPLRAYVLVGGLPGVGKSTLAATLAPELGLALLSKDGFKEALAAEFGAPPDVEASRELGRRTVRLLLRLARGCPGAVIDSTWYDYTRPWLADLTLPLVEVRCLAPLPVVRSRFRSRHRDPGHFDADRTEDELWGEPVAPLGVGPLVEVPTEGPVDVPALARLIRRTVADANGPRDQ